MAIYHLSTKPISRSSGRSAVASIAYRAGVKITDERLGKEYDYTKRNGVLWTGMSIPHGFQIDRSELWNTAEKMEKRSNSRTAREIVINIPHELMQGDQATGKMLAYEFACHLSYKYKVAVDVAVHAPDKAGDDRNFHAHLLLTTRQVEQSQDGFSLGKKSQLEMSNAQLKKLGLLSNQDELKQIRKEWAELANEYLAEHNMDARIDHRSHKDRGLQTLPTIKMGWQATELERKGIRTDVGDQNRAIRAYNAQIEQQNTLKEQLKHQQAENRSKNNQKWGQNPPILPKSEDLTQERNQNTLKNAQKPALKPRKSENGTKVAPKPEDTLKTQNRAFSEKFILSDDEYRKISAFLQEFHQHLEKIAKEILGNRLKALKEQAKPVLAAFEKLRDNEPWFFGKDKWRQDKQQTLDAYNAIKNKHDTMRDQGITLELIREANKQVSQTNPEYHQKAKQASLKIAQHKQAKLDSIAKQRGADEYAKPNERYSGKIIKSIGSGFLQQTSQGIVYHNLKGLSIGEDCTIEYNDDASQATCQKNYEVRVPRTKEQNHDQER